MCAGVWPAFVTPLFPDGSVWRLMTDREHWVTNGVEMNSAGSREAIYILLRRVATGEVSAYAGHSRRRKIGQQSTLVDRVRILRFTRSSTQRRLMRHDCQARCIPMARSPRAACQDKALALQTSSPTSDVSESNNTEARFRTGDSRYA